MTRSNIGLSIASAVLALAATGAEARVTRLDISTPAAPAFNGRAFGKAGVFETLSGVFHGELDPNDKHNAIITDLKRAPRNARGMVEYSATFALARPADMTKSSGVLIYSVPNRGGGNVTGSNDGNLMVVSGWQGDIQPAANRQAVTVPVAPGVTGPALARWIDMDDGVATLPLGSGARWAVPRPAPASLDTSKAKLTITEKDGAPGTDIAPSDWAFADCATMPFPGKPDATKICVKGGFHPKYAYTLSYVAKDPLVLGIGYAATRDLITFLKTATADDAGTPNPARGTRWAVGTGVSQSANYLRSLVHLGFNLGEDDKIVFDGINPQASARQNALNFRFADPGGQAALYDYGIEAALWWGDYQDRLRGLPDTGLLHRCTMDKVCPKVVEFIGSSEMWGLRASASLIGTDAKSDIPLPANVRRYYDPGVTHTGGRGGFSSDAAAAGACIYPANPNPASDTARALLADLVDWVAHGTEPPASNYPRLARGELITPEAAMAAFPKIPGNPRGVINPFQIYDYGADFDYADLSGVMTAPTPRVTGFVPQRVARIDADGNEIDGVRSVLLQAPLGTYTGWNIKRDGYYAGTSCSPNGAFFPFAKTRAERAASGDLRPSLEERYGDHAGYVARVRAAADRNVAARVLLREDADRLIAEAGASNILKPAAP